MKPLAFALFVVAVHLAIAGMAASRHLLPPPAAFALLASETFR
jgi:CBS-domain-containing membrane protein